MKVFLNIAGGILSTVITLVLLILFLGLGIKISAGSFLTTESISNSVAEIEITELLVDKDGNETDIGKNFYESLNESGLKKEDINKLLENKKVKKLVGNYLGSVVVNKLNKKEEIKYPTKDELVEVVEENIGSLAVSLELDVELNDKTKSEIKQLVNDNYDDIIKGLESISKELDK